MSCGIYKLTFKNVKGCYIGQSTHINRRVSEHRRLLRNNFHYNAKLQKAYNNSNELTVEILEECALDMLDELEYYYITEMDSVINGFNITKGLTAGGRGVEASKSKYSREELIEILLTNPELSNKDISELTNLPITIVEAVAYGKRHLWLQEEFPTIWKQVQDIINSNIRFYSSNNINKRNNITHTVISPEGVEYTFSNIAAFAREFNLNRSHLCQLVQGKAKHHKHWTRKGGSDE